MSLLTLKRLMDWAGPRKFEEGRQLFLKGGVQELEYHPPLVSGRVSYGARDLRTAFRLLPDGSVDSQCPCYDNRERGIICAHVVALGLELHRRQNDPERLAQVEEERRRAERAARFSAGDYVRRARAGDAADARPAALVIALPEDWPDAARQGRPVVHCAIEYDGQRRPLGDAPRDVPFSFAPRDENLLFVLEDIAGGPCPSQLELTPRDFVNLLRLFEGRAFAPVNGGAPVPVLTDRVTLRLKAVMDTATGELELTAIIAGEEPASADRRCYVLDRRAGFLFDGRAFRPLATLLPEPLQDVYRGPVRIPRASVPRFLQAELPALSKLVAVECEVRPDMLTIEPAEPVFRLALRGSPASLSATFYADYGVVTLPAGKPDASGLFAIPDPEDLLRYTVRAPEREQAALRQLAAAGFIGDHGETLRPIIGCREVANFLARDYPALRRRGWKIEIQGRANEFLETARYATPVVRLRQLGAGLADDFEVRFDFEDLEGASVSPAEIQRALLKGDSFIEREGRMILFDAGAVQSLRAVFEDCAGGPGSEPGAFRLSGMHAAYVKASLDSLDGVDVEAPPVWRSLAASQTERVEPEPVPLPPALEGALRPYQREGVQWLRFLERCGFAGILADEMGLGKTIQTLAWLSLERHHPDARGKPALIICPTSLVENWAEEAARWTPHLRVCMMSGAERHARWEESDRAHLVITSYALIRRDCERYAERQFSALVLDEAQHIKNRSTQNAIAAKSLRAFHRLVLTGTPVENSVADLWSILDFLMPDYLGRHEAFRRNYELPIAQGGPEGDEAQIRLRRKLQPFLLRRVKRDVARELPPKMEKIAHSPLTADQARVYQELLEFSRRRVADLVAAEGFNAARMEVLKVLLRLRQVCCHLDLLKLPDVRFEAPSGKMDLLFELLDEAIDGGHRVLLFSQFVFMLAILRREMDARGLRYCYLDGQTKDRLEVAREFNTQRDIPVFLISLKAGGTGLNLTGADMVIHYDPWWNPAVEDQATDRAHRIGQQRAVYTIKLITRGTIEEKVLALQQRKQRIIDATVLSDEEVIGKMNWDDIRQLLDL